MTRRGLGTTIALVAVLVLLLSYLGKLQWDWLRSIENYEHVRLNSVFSRSSWYLKTAFDQEIESVARCFRVPGGRREQIGEQLAERLVTWRGTSRWPDLFQEVFLISARGDTESLRLEVFDPLSGRLEPAWWAPDLEALEAQVAELLLADESPPPRRGLGLRVLPTMPAVLVETFLQADEMDGRGSVAWLAVRLDEDYLWQEMVPELVEILFPPPNHLGTELAIVEAGSGRLVFSTLPIDSLLEFGRSDATLGLVDAGTDGEELPRVGMRPPQGREAYPNASRPPTEADHEWFRNFWARISYSGHWHLYVQRGGVPVADEVLAARWRSSLTSFGLLALVSAAVGVVAILARRSQMLARQQMSFLAGVTHELRTPLAVLSAAGDNLADSLVEDEKQLEEYGRVIQGETARLQEMVENVLQMARRTANPEMDMRPTDVGEVVRAALRRSERQIEQARFAVESDLGPGSLRVRGNARTLQSAVLNLISNALKYGRSARWLKVSVGAPGEDWKTVRISIEDRGPGIEPGERRRIFEPFYRCGRAREAQIEGSGLGLAIVRDVARAHGGRIAVEPGAAGGARFVLDLPRLHESGATA